MKIDFDKASRSFITTPLREEHWSEFRDFYTGLQAPAHYIDPAREPSDPSPWKAILSDMAERGNDLFALWHEEEIVGMTGIVYGSAGIPGEGIAVMTGTQLADGFIGQGLSSILYDVRLNHLKAQGFRGTVETYIEEGNTPSIRAAEKNGFEHDPTRMTPTHDLYLLRDDAGDFTP